MKFDKMLQGSLTWTVRGILNSGCDAWLQGTQNGEEMEREDARYCHDDVHEIVRRNRRQSFTKHHHFASETCTDRRAVQSSV